MNIHRKTNNVDVIEKRSQTLFIIIFVLTIVIFTTIGTLSYRYYKHQFQAQVDSQLVSIGLLKVKELQSWREEQLSDAEVFNTPLFSSVVERYLINPSDVQAKDELKGWIAIHNSKDQSDGSILLDAAGNEKISLPDTALHITSILAREAITALNSRKVTFLDFHRDTIGGQIYLAILVPIFNSQDNRPLGTLILRINPYIYLYPFLQTWPVPSISAESFLVRQESTDFMFLSDLRFKSGSALTLRFPLLNTTQTAGQAVLGHVGIVEGDDYRGVPVIADVRPVPDSPWFLVSRIDSAEVFAPLEVRLRQTIWIFCGLGIAAGFGLWFVWRQQRLRYYQMRYESSQALTASEEKFRKAFMISPDSVSLSRLSDGRFVAVNHGFTKIIGYTESEVLGKTSLDLKIWYRPLDRSKLTKKLYSTGFVENFETSFVTKSGDIRKGLLSATIIDLDGQQHFLITLRDITDSKVAELALIFQSTHDILTGLFNRQYYEAEMKRLQNSRRYPISLLVIDMNGLKTINDTLGHGAGDEHLRVAAQVIKRAFRSEELIARIGGDEFVVVLPETDTTAALHAVLRIKTKVEEYNKDCPAGHKISLAIGSATGKDKSDLGYVFKQADKHMYKDKTRNGKSSRLMKVINR